MSLVKSTTTFQVTSLTIICYKKFCITCAHIFINELKLLPPQDSYVIGMKNIRASLILPMIIFGVSIPQRALARIDIFVECDLLQYIGVDAINLWYHEKYFHWKLDDAI